MRAPKFIITLRTCFFFFPFFHFTHAVVTRRVTRDCALRIAVIFYAARKFLPRWGDDRRKEMINTEKLESVKVSFDGNFR